MLRIVDLEKKSKNIVKNVSKEVELLDKMVCRGKGKREDIVKKIEVIRFELNELEFLQGKKS